MDYDLLDKHIHSYLERFEENKSKLKEDYRERNKRVDYYRSFTPERILSMDEENLTEFIGKLWAMRLWGNKERKVEKFIEDNGLQSLRSKLSDLIWGDGRIEDRWDDFRGSIKGFGPAMMSELLCMTHPKDYMVWNRRAYVAFDYLGVEDIPRYNYQHDGEKYAELCGKAKEIAEELREAGLDDVDLVMVDFFIWQELQVESNLNKVFRGKQGEQEDNLDDTDEEYKFVHEEIKKKVAEVGEWLGFTTSTETKVAEGSRVDAVWESTIGNMGRVIYVFEVQTKGSINSLIVNLLKSLNNPAVQGVVAVSDERQLETIKRHAEEINALEDKLKYWDYKEVMDNHDALALVHDSINELELVPESF